MDTPKRDALYWMKDMIVDDLLEFGQISSSWYSDRDPRLVALAVEQLKAEGLIEVHATPKNTVYLDANGQRALENILMIELFSNPLELEDSDVIGTRPYFTADEIYKAAQKLEKQGELEIHNKNSPRRIYMLPEATRMRMLESMVMDFVSMN